MTPISFPTLAFTAVSLGMIHTLLGPDHYVPFAVISRASGWSLGKTMWVTVLCGFGHVLSSVVPGFFGIKFGTMLSQLEFFEDWRGEWAAWFLIAFGMIYALWGFRLA